jgi:23S rRNA pseudouridine1911/1915/1917 synthase
VFRAVNRLDRDTSGLVVVAKHQHSANALSGKIAKEYTAIACGEIEAEVGTVDAPIQRLAPERQIRIVSEDGQHAVTHYQVLARGCGYTLMKLTLETGRTHQIRVHMAHIGHPLAGDAMYGGSLVDIQRQALHCGRVEFTNEITKKCINIQADLCEDMQKLLQ